LRVFAAIAGWVCAVVLAVPAGANPVTYGQQLCVMLASGINQDKAWAYIVQEHIKASMANPQAVIPWYSAASAGWTLGTAIGRNQQVQEELAAMKPDVFKVARSTCPQHMNRRRSLGGKPGSPYRADQR
jgi:hypothetical protein